MVVGVLSKMCESAYACMEVLSFRSRKTMNAIFVPGRWLYSMTSASTQKLGSLPMYAFRFSLTYVMLHGVCGVVCCAVVGIIFFSTY